MPRIAIIKSACSALLTLLRFRPCPKKRRAPTTRPASSCSTMHAEPVIP